MRTSTRRTSGSWRRAWLRWATRRSARSSRTGTPRHRPPCRSTTGTLAITPDKGVGELSAIYSGRGREAEEAREHLSAIIGVLNERFGLALGTADQLFFDQMEATWLGDPHLVAQARANPLENFRLVFADRFIKSIVERMDDNADIFGKILDEPAFQAVVMEHYLQRVFDRARSEPPAPR